jgi:alpha-glucosidase
MISDYPDAIRHQPGAEFVKVVPAAWDQTIGLAGRVGEYIVVARRKGRDWFVGAMTDSTGRDLSVPMDFLDAAQYRATIYADGAHAAKAPTDLALTQRMVGADERLVLSLAPAGGCAVHLQPVD